MTHNTTTGASHGSADAQPRTLATNHVLYNVMLNMARKATWRSKNALQNGWTFTGEVESAFGGVLKYRPILTETATGQKAAWDGWQLLPLAHLQTA